MTKTVDKRVTMVLQDVTSQLSNLVDSFDGDNFDQQNLLPYKEVSLLHVILANFYDCRFNEYQTHDSESRGQEEAGRTRQTSELFTRSTALKFVNTLNKSP